MSEQRMMSFLCDTLNTAVEICAKELHWTEKQRRTNYKDLLARVAQMKDYTPNEQMLIAVNVILGHIKNSVEGNNVTHRDMVV